MFAITMVVPTYKDLPCLRVLLDLIEEERSQTITYLIVDNGSNDSEVSRALSASSKFWNSIQLTQNLGFGGGIAQGIKAADTAWIGWMPGNLKILPKDVEKMCRQTPIEKGNFIKCRRIRTSRVARAKTLVSGIVQSFITRQALFDTGGTPTICEREFFLSLKNVPTDYIIESRLLSEAKTRGLKIYRPRISYGERPFGESHWQRGIKSEIRLMRAICKDSINIRKGIMSRVPE
jgi:glycosyltransferase involved in cell wall biosynthesis